MGRRVISRLRSSQRGNLRPDLDLHAVGGRFPYVSRRFLVRLATAGCRAHTVDDTDGLLALQRLEHRLRRGRGAPSRLSLTLPRALTPVAAAVRVDRRLWCHRCVLRRIWDRRQ